MRYSIALTLVFCSFSAYSQTLWNHLYDRPILTNSINYYTSDLKTTADNGYIFAFTNGIPNWDNGGSIQSYAIKTDSLFQPQWSKIIKGANPKCFPLADNTIMFFSGLEAEMYIEKSDNMGTTLMAQKLAYNFATPFHISPSIYPIYKGNGKFKLLGNISNYIAPINTYKMFTFLCNMDSLGNVSQFDTLVAYYPAFQMNIYFNPTFFTGNPTTGEYYMGGRDINDFDFVAKLDSNHNILWKYWLRDTVGQLSLNPSYAITLSNGDLLLAVKDDYEFTLMRISTSGTLLWAKYLSDPNAESVIGSMQELPNGEILATLGYQYYQAATSSYISLPLVAKLDANGNILWHRTFFTGATMPLFKSNNEWIYAAYNGFANKPSIFNSDTLGNSFCHDSTFAIANMIPCPLYLSFYYDISVAPKNIIWTAYTDTLPQPFTLQDTCINYPPTPMSVSTSQFNHPTCTVHPNPAQSNLHFTLNEQINETATIKIYNTLGEIILEFPLNPSSPQKTINLQHWSKGIYYYSTSIREGTERGKILITN